MLSIKEYEVLNRGKIGFWDALTEFLEQLEDIACDALLELIESLIEKWKIIEVHYLGHRRDVYELFANETKRSYR